MHTIIPAIIPQSFEHLTHTLEAVAPFTRAVQIDVVDGIFVPFTSWPYSENAQPEAMREVIQGFDVEIDLMVQEPEKVAEAYLKAGATKLVVHLESTTHLEEIVALKATYSFMLGLSIESDTEVSVLTNALEHAEYVQLMGIAKIGSQGQPFDIRVLTRIRELKAVYPALVISIDGSVNKETLPLLVDAGAERFVAGSSILGAENLQEAYEALTHA